MSEHRYQGFHAGKFQGSDGPKLSIGWIGSNQTEKRLIGCTWGIDARKG
jgi:hypothetical protein